MGPELACRRYRCDASRLVSAGVDVSDVRTGRKPGTRVLTVRNGTCGIPTLLVERTALLILNRLQVLTASVV